MKSTIFFKNTTPELILAFLFSASIYKSGVEGGQNYIGMFS